MVTGQRVDDVCAVLENFHMMSKIVSITIIDRYENVKDVLVPNSGVDESSTTAEIAKAVIKSYEFYATTMYNHGRKSVLTRFREGDAETFYFHAFRWYIPHFMKKMYALHKLGIAVMTMEGFKHKNFTSKHAIEHRTNGRGNVCKQSLKILHLFFKSGYHNVIRELKKRANEHAKKTNDGSLDAPQVEQLINDYLIELV